MNQYCGIAHNKDDNKQNEDDKNDCDNIWGILNDLELLEGLGWPKIHQKSKINLLPIPYGSLGIIDRICVRVIRNPSKSRPTKHPEKSGFSKLSK